MKQEVVKIFDDLDDLLNFCRFELLPFDQKDLYNRQSKVWQAFEASKRPRRDYQDRKFRPQGYRSGRQ